MQDSEDVETWDGRLIAAGRALATIGVRELAEVAEMSVAHVSDLERRSVILVSPTRRHGFVARETWEKLLKAFKDYGVELTQEGNGRGAGVRWAQERALR